MGNITSLALMFMDIAANNVPDRDRPKRAGKDTHIISRGDRVILNNIIKTGTNIASMTTKNIKLDSTFPRKITSRPIGEVNNP